MYLSILRGVGRESCNDEIAFGKPESTALILITFEAQRATQCLYWYWQKLACAGPALTATRVTIRDADNMPIRIRIPSCMKSLYHEEMSSMVILSLSG